MPTEPAATPWKLEPAPDDHPHDLWALGADLAPGTLLAGYRLGLFPMPVQDELGWWSPRDRGIVELDAFRPSRSLRRSRNRYEIRFDTAFEEVMRCCADPRRPHGWIDEPFVAAYSGLHRLGWAHSIEAWDEDGLAGGLYGVGIGGLFAAESKFHRRTDASKVALAALVDRMRSTPDAGRRMLDVQWLTPHLASLGAVAISRADYLVRLSDALLLRDLFVA
ncbi:MAG: leucyl/phenylalanyl-tRNA--protein transferase [Actinobacteria bacterium]|nr:leucyl/phenylalanyl-tRNA--protein transferase [Actinomycetota bacterium]